MKYEFVVPEEIGLMGVEISVKSDSSIEVYDDDWGQYLAAQNQILLTERICASALFEAFCHEVSEAIADKFINQGKKNSYDVPHEIIDAYGRGIHNFIVENAHLVIVKVEDDKLD
jgi:hypothetical protein